ncbi:helix-turn-helix domain-containing protein [Streptomyces sp. 549]|uniref:helix-turn-helix domain-containing protein n=1 Tax=Streptomyces sp. 549 TaxID=3049076 RepID=UPI0024C29780|nr:helix-turn-helix domain-containing protein [Streptomyces sp. 549]MDK1475299.1 helix-turn-helix domain-containing protein [Streptomyces sp. 549]
MTYSESSAPPCAPPAVPARGVTHVRARHTDRFTVVGNHLAQHRELTLTAIGLAVHIQSLPQGARVDIRSLSDRFPEGETRIAGALRELEAHGYLTRTRRRLPSGRIVTRTVCHHRPGPADDAAARPGVQGPDVRRPAARGPSLRAVPARGPRATGATAGRTSPATAPSCPTPPPPPPAPVAPAPPTPLPPPAIPAPTATPVPTATPPLPMPVCTDPGRMRTATALLGELHRHEPRLLLAEREVRRLAPAVAAWLERGASPDVVRRALANGLPEPLHHPAGLVAHRLTALLPQQLHAPPQAVPAPAPPPLRNCGGCDRAFRAPASVRRCRECREREEGTGATESIDSGDRRHRVDRFHRAHHHD